MNIPEDILSTLTDEQKKLAEAAQSPEELLELAKENGIELTPDQLGVAAGGVCWHKCIINCPQRNERTPKVGS